MYLDFKVLEFSNSSSECSRWGRGPRRRKGFEGLPRRPLGRPNYNSTAARRYCLTKFKADGAWRGTTAPGARKFSKATMRRAIADLVKEGILESRRSKLDARGFVARLKLKPGQVRKKIEPKPKRGVTPQFRAQNSPPYTPIGSAFQNKEDRGGPPAKGSIPSKIRALAFQLVEKGVACTPDDPEQPIIQVQALKWLHYDNCKIMFSPRTVWSYAAKALNEGFSALAIFRAYSKALHYCHGLATDRKRIENPALTVWLARKDLAADGLKRMERIRLIQKKRMAYDHHIANLLKSIPISRNSPDLSFPAVFAASGNARAVPLPAGARTSRSGDVLAKEA